MIEDGDELIRRDYSAEAWTGPPEGSVGWWKGRMPQAGARKLVLAPDAVLIDMLRGLAEHQEQKAVRYLLALTLLRKRVVSVVEDTANANRIEPGPPTMRLRVQADGSEVDVETCTISKAQTEELQAALQDLLYCEAGE